ncbi:MAG: hypothetical protein ISP43_03905 [Candidatus Puniceispirillum sp.]|nr:hypothetical protein [Candidatus Puniceispirillum sp.]MBL6774631.1 hypothetical protein [Candidatus Puniceispirillum sp.]
MPYICRRILIACFTVILPVAAAAQPASPQDTPVKAAENATICAAFAKVRELQIELYPKAAKNDLTAWALPLIGYDRWRFSMSGKVSTRMIWI